MTDAKRDDPLMEDLKTYAAEADATLTVPHFVGWLLRHRPQLARLDIRDLEAMAQESLHRFAHAPDPQ